MNDFYTILREPIITEKSEILRTMHNRVVFLVERKTNKETIKKAVEKIFKVKVKKINTTNLKGKKKRYGQRIGKRPDYKKAFIDLMPGSKIDLFEGLV